MAPIRALIFDVDGTLAETEEVHRAAFNRAFAEAGLGWHWDQTLYARLLKVPGGLPRLLSYLDTVEPGASAVRRGEMAAVHEAKAALYARMVDERLVQLRPGVERLIDEAHSRGLEIVLATTSSRSNAEALILATLQIEGLEKIRAIVGGDEVALKPEPDIYLKALEVLGLSARQCLVFEDSQSGLSAATAAGLRTIVTPSTYQRGADFSGALAVLSHLGDQFEAYEHIAGAGEGESLVSVPALQRWVADDDDMLGLLTIGGRPVF